MKKSIFSKYPRIPLLVLIISLLLTAVIIPAGAASAAGIIVSPALSILSLESEMVKSGLLYSDIEFNTEDFERALHVSKINSITVTSLPPAFEGVLKLGGDDVRVNQIIPRSELSMLRFVPASGAVGDSTFTFSAGGNYDYHCKLYILTEFNFAPTISFVDANNFSVSTQKNISVYGNLKAYDPEGDRLYYEIISYPSKGTVTLLDAGSGDFRYTPGAGYTGKDSFTYTVRDKYGNYSDSAKITIRVNKPDSSAVYADMDGHWAHNAALRVTAKNIMKGAVEDGVLRFNPEETVSRADFLVMLMNTDGINSVPSTINTGFADDAQIPYQVKGYVAAAHELGYINGVTTEEGLCFFPVKGITRAEAAVLINNVIEADQPAVRPVFADNSSIPAWAADAIYALNSLGVFNGLGGGYISPSQELTRAQTAQILCSIMDLK